MSRFAVLLLLALPLAACTTLQPTSSARPACDLVGAWQPTSLVLTAPDGTDNVVEIGTPPGLKVFSESRWVFVEQGPSEDNFTSGGGGRYVTTDSTYTEYVEYHAAPSFVGETITFDCVVDGDTWTQSGMLPGGTYLVETYRRIE